MTRLSRLPFPIAYFLGHRKPNHVQKTLPKYRLYFWSFLAAWLGIAVLEITFTYSNSFQAHNAPMIVASFGATAVLIYGAIDSPLAQPRNVFCGQLIGSLTGVIIAQLFLNIQHSWASESQRTVVEWVGGATAMSLSLVIMQMTRTVHPPGGATALIAVITPSIVDIAWFYIAIVIVSTVLQITIACLVNNVERKYPQYWWTPIQLPLQVDTATLNTMISKPDHENGSSFIGNVEQEIGGPSRMGRLDSIMSITSGIANNNRDTFSVMSVDHTPSQHTHTSTCTVIESLKHIEGAISTIKKHIRDTTILQQQQLSEEEKVTLENLLTKLLHN